ncbi:hypothetical protein [Azospirillum sp. SYSU D00513]|uniref:hypothetical protein n=1 Tax=Azospirillum sp. SYSU D00513 TaxID=2812561 RepID=UPI001A974F6C|nr:hypothetical protein [Azospirillum sp. SYSU D00513]
MRTPDSDSRPIQIDARRLVMCLLLVFSFFVAVSLAQNIVAHATGYLDPAKKIWLLEVDEERSLYTWLSSTLMAFIAALNLIVALERRRDGRLPFLQWFSLSVIFLVFSVDEALSFHEKMGNLLPEGMKTGFTYFRWVIPAGIACLIGLVFYIPFILGFPGKARMLLIASAGVFLSGAIGMEMLGGAIVEGTDGVPTLTYRLVSSLEEAMEGYGLILFLHAVLLYRHQYGRTMSIQV